MKLSPELERLRAIVNDFCELLVEEGAVVEVRAEYQRETDCWVFMINAPDGRAGLGRIIGTHGKTIQALRSLVHAVGRRLDVDVNLCTYDRAPATMRREQYEQQAASR